MCGAVTIWIGPFSALKHSCEIIAETSDAIEQRGWASSTQTTWPVFDALSMIVRSVRVGIPVSEAMRHVARQSLAPTAAEFERIASDLSIGTRLDLSLKAMAQRAGLPEYQFFATALSLQSQTGGGLTETLENLADVIRKRVALRSKAYALASEARASSLVLAVLPFVSGLGLAVLSPDYIAVLFVEEAGRNLLGIAFLSLGTGILAMRTIIRTSLK